MNDLSYSGLGAAAPQQQQQQLHPQGLHDQYGPPAPPSDGGGMRRRPGAMDRSGVSYEPVSGGGMAACLPCIGKKPSPPDGYIHRAYGYGEPREERTDWLGIVAKVLVGTAAIMGIGSRLGGGGGGGGDAGGPVDLDAGRAAAPYLSSHTARSGLFDDYPSLSGLDLSDPSSLNSLPPLPFDPTSLNLPPLAPGTYPGASLSPLVGPGSNLGHVLRPRLLRPPGPPSRRYVPQDLPGMKMAWDPRDSRMDTPVFWDVPFSGGRVALDVMRVCHRLVSTGMRGMYDVRDGETELRIIHPGSASLSYPTSDLVPFVNVDTSTVPGIARARDLGLAPSRLADIVVTPLIYEADTLFHSQQIPGAGGGGRRGGRLFAIFRHPIDRAADLFYYAKVAHWERDAFSPQLASMSIDQYAKSPLVENNWMTRQLSGVLEGELTQDHLTAALEVLRTRFLVGLEAEMDASLDRFERYFGWTYRVDPVGQEACRSNFVSRGQVHPNPHRKELVEGTEAYEAVFWQNQMDLEIYDYAVMLFREQGEFVAETKEGMRNQGATCCACDPPTFPPGYRCPGAADGTGARG